MNPAEKDKSERSEAARLYEMSSEKNRNLLLFYLVVIAYILAIVLSTTDLDLLLPESSITPPVFSVGVPIFFFYALSPPLVLIFHFNLLHNTTEHLNKIKRWKGNRKTIPSYRLHPYIVDFAYLSPPQGMWGKILVSLTNFLLYFLAPACLLCIQLGFSDYQSLGYSSWHFIWLLADSWLLILFFVVEHKLGDQDNKNASLLKKYRGRFFMITLIFVVGLANLSIVWMLQSEQNIDRLQRASAELTCIIDRFENKEKFTKCVDKNIRQSARSSWIIPKITISSGTRIQKQSLEELQLIAAQTGTDETTAWEMHGENYDLSNRRLVFSDLSGSNMQKIVLEKAYLQGANMAGAQMQGANMEDTRMQGANMRGAQMQGANMKDTRMQGANMRWAQMQGASMRGAQMQDADMQDAQMQGADMKDAQMQGADMLWAQMQGADMRGAQMQDADMRWAQMQDANMWKAQMQGADIRWAQMQGADMEDARMQGADMWSAQMQGADMWSAQMQGADMWKAQMQGADMTDAQMQGADMSRAQMQGADMTDAQMQGADMTDAQMQGANMRGANLRGSFCDEEKYDSFFDRSNIRIEDEENYNSFFDRINARIEKEGLEGCNAIEDGQFGLLTQDTADSIIGSLRENPNIPKEIIDDIEKSINTRVGKVADMTEVETEVLNLKEEEEEACEIIANWQEDVKNTPKVKDAFADWLDTEAGKNSELQKCATASQVRTPPQSSEKIDGVKAE